MQETNDGQVNKHVLPPLEMPKCVQDVKTDLVQIFLSNMSSDEVRARHSIPVRMTELCGTQCMH